MAGSTRYKKNGDPKIDVGYEWSLEYINQHGDAVDLDFADQLDTLWEDWKNWKPAADAGDDAPVRVELVLLRRAGNDDDGELERGYAYVTAGGLPLEFDCGHKVPARFLVQVANK